MPLSNSLAFYDEILSKFLYGRPAAPVYLIDEALIRPDGAGTSVSVSKADYMEGPGRFALPSMFRVVQAFFEASDTDLGGGSEITFNLGQILSQLNLTDVDRRISFNQANFDDGEDDYAYRTFFWSSSAFQITDGAQFVVHGDGTRSIENLIVDPRGDGSGNDNFDWQGGGPAVYLNDLVRPLVDPFMLGGDGSQEMDRTVLIELTGSASQVSYSYQDYLDDKLSGITELNYVNYGDTLLNP